MTEFKFHDVIMAGALQRGVAVDPDEIEEWLTEHGGRFNYSTPGTVRITFEDDEQDAAFAFKLRWM